MQMLVSIGKSRIAATQTHAQLSNLGCLQSTFHVVEDILNVNDVLCFFIGNLEVKFLFQGHDQFHHIQGIRTQIVHYAGVASNVFLLDSQLISDNLNNSVLDFPHVHTFLLGQVNY